MLSPSRSTTRHSLSVPRRPNSMPRLDQQSAAEGVSPVRKQPRRQSLPARLSAPRTEEYDRTIDRRGVSLSSYVSGTPGKIPGDIMFRRGVPDHLTRGQKSFYSCLVKVRRCILVAKILVLLCLDLSRVCNSQRKRYPVQQ